MPFVTTNDMSTPFTKPEHVLTKASLEHLEKCSGISDLDTWTAIFFLLSKSEHNNMKWDDTFTGEDGKSVFFYAKRLPYDGEQRGVTTGIAGWTTANDGKDTYGDFHKLAVRYKRMGGVDLRKLAKGLTKDTDKAGRFCEKIKGLHGDMADLWVETQLKHLARPDGYIFESCQALKDAGIPHPSPLTVAAVVDTAINQGFGGKWCPKAWLKEHAVTTSDDELKLLREFLAWKRVAATKNHHNSPPSNGEERADMFLKLLDAGGLCLKRNHCESVVTWKMK